MRTTIQQPILNGKTGVPSSVEVLLTQMRVALNSVGRFEGSVTTANTGALTNVWVSDDLPSDSVIVVSAKIIGASSTHSVLAYYDVVGVVGRLGVATPTVYVAPVALTSSETNAAMGFDLVISGNTAAVQVNDGSQGTVVWRAYIELMHL
jgi:hypothetical protein